MKAIPENDIKCFFDKKYFLVENWYVLIVISQGKKYMGLESLRHGILARGYLFFPLYIFVFIIFFDFFHH